MTERTLSKLYQDACTADDRVFDEIDIGDLIDLAEGRLAGERRFQLVSAIAQSPRLATAYRIAKAGGEWSRALASDLAQEGRAAPTVAPTVVPFRRSAPRRQRLALAAAVSAMAVGAVFVGQRMQAPDMPGAIDPVAIENVVAGSDSILAASFGRNGDADVIFSARSVQGEDRIFSSSQGS